MLYATIIFRNRYDYMLGCKHDQTSKITFATQKDLDDFLAENTNAELYSVVII